MKKNLVIGIISCCLVGIVGCGIGVVVLNNRNVSDNNDISENENIFENSHNNKNAENEIDKYLGNGIESTNNSRIAYKGNNYVYYKNLGGSNRIVRMDSNGKKEEITRYTPEIEFEYDNKLYVSSHSGSNKSIYTLNLNSTNSELNKIIDSSNLGFNRFNDVIYFNNADTTNGTSDFFKYNQNGTNDKVISNIGSYFIKDNKIYYNKIDGSNTSALANMYQSGLFVSNLDFSDEKILLDSNIVSSIVVEQNFIFFLSDNKLYRSNLDGTELIKLSDESIEEYQLTSNYIYYKTRLSQKLYRMKYDGTNSTLLINDNVSYFDLIDNYVYFVGSSNYSINRMYNNGTKVENIKIDSEL